MKGKLQTLKDVGSVLFCCLLTAFGVYSIYQVFHWKTGMMQYAVYGSWPDSTQKAIHFVFGLVFVIGGIGLGVNTVVQARRR
jgi:hypothetical protein